MTIALSTPPVARQRLRFRSACILRTFPPMYVSSASTSPDSFSNVPFCSARRIRCPKNHALFCVMPKARCNSYELIPFFALTISHIPTNHLSKVIGLSSIIVPTLMENWRRFGQHSQVHTLRLAVNETLSEPQRGHFTPSVQRIETIKLRATSPSAK